MTTSGAEPDGNNSDGHNSQRRFRRASEIFESARQLPPAERAAIATASCGDDAALLGEVHALLAHHELGGDALDRGMFRPGATPDVLPIVGTIIGRYRIEGLLGEGGMGSVYRATQFEPVRREVALKLIKLGMDTRHVVRRFEMERQTLARLEHPNIAHVLDGGATSDGRPYFVMDLVRGVPITDHCDAERLGWRARVELVIQVCAAVQHAHQRGILHRDLKPSNILVTRVDAARVPKVIDFGVAKALDASSDDASLGSTWGNTVAGHAVGTPDYMSPEQADGNDVDTRTDVYALGVVLYQLLVGTTPLRARGTSRGRSDGTPPKSPPTSELRRRLRDDEPLRPSSAIDALKAPLRATDAAGLRRALRGDLDSIVLKALARDVPRRYPTVAAFADDLGRLLRNEPVTARPPSTAYLLSKFARRHTVALIATSAVIVSILIGFGVSVYGLRSARVERDAAQKAEGEQTRLAGALRAQLFASDVERGRQSVRQGSWPDAHDLLWTAFIADPTSPQARWALREMVWTEGCVAMLHLASSVETVRFLPGGEQLFVCAREGRPIVYDIAAGTSAELDGPSLGAWEVAVNRDGTIGCTANLSGGVIVWDLRPRSPSTSFPPRTILQYGGGRVCVQCSRDENVAFAGGSDGVLWRIALDDSEPRRPIGFGAPITRIVLAPDGTVATGGDDGSVNLVAPDGSQQRIVRPERRRIQSIAFGQEGRLMATGTTSATITITDTTTGELVQTLSTRLGTAREMRFGADDQSLLVLGWWRVWEIDRVSEAVRPVISMSGWRFDVLPDGSALALAGSATRSASVWRLGPNATSVRGSAPEEIGARPIAGSRESGALTFLGGADEAVLGLDERGRTLWTMPSSKPRSMNSNSDGSLFAILTRERRVRVYRTSDRSLVAESENARLGDAATLAFCGSSLLAYATRDGAVWIIDLKTGEECQALAPRKGEVLAVAFSPDGGMLSVCERNFLATIVNLATGDQTHEISASTGFSTAFSQDGQFRLVGTWRGDLLVRDVITGATRMLRGHSARIGGIVPHPSDPDIVLTHSDDGTVRVWHLGFFREVLSVTPFVDPSYVRAAGFLGDGDRIAMVGVDGAMATYSIALADRCIDRMLVAERARLQGIVPIEGDEP